MPVLNQRCIRENRIDASFARRHDTAFRSVKNERILKLGDALVNSTGVGTLGRTAEVTDSPPVDTTVDSHVSIVRPTPGIFVPGFFGYLLQSIETDISAAGMGSGGQTELSQTSLKSFTVTFPESHQEQERIVRILDAAFALIDGAIENAQQIQAIAEDLFRSELTETTNQLSRWPRKLLPEIATEFGRGRSRHRPRNAKHLYGGPYPFIQTGDIRNSDHWINDFAQSYSEAGLEQSKLWPEGTVCITIAANIAESGILGFEACFPDSVIGAVLKPDLMDPEFLEYLLQADKVRLQAKGKGTAQANINLGTFQSHPYPVPPLPEQQRLVARLSALREALWRLSNVSSAKLIKLSDLRQSLLQQAFSGGLSLEPRDVDVLLGGVRT